MRSPQTTTPWLPRKATSAPPIAVRDPLALGGIERQAVVVRVDGDAAVKAHRVLRQRGVEAAVRGERQRGRVRHVGVQDAGLAAQAMDGGVDEHRRRLDGVAAGEPCALRRRP